MSYFEDNEDRIIYGGGMRRRRPAPPPVETKCPHCGETGLQFSGVGKDRYLFKPGLGRHLCHRQVLNDFEDLTK